MSWCEVAVTHLGPRAETGREEVGRLGAGGAGQALAWPGPGPGPVPPRSEEGAGPPLPSGPPPCVLRQRWARRREPIGRAGSAGD